ncbi:hypothetical protein RF11_16381 [Thelohanellus kitauei]|uniref:Uncharacterized protein n=1 Tax=Thelohanellus kitauei TaxID=669202 RepID=A0A0C2MPI3_THEKT|nr:hypothetical protein RF11_16381 [Thelohanellus kitauei]
MAIFGIICNNDFGKICRIAINLSQLCFTVLYFGTIIRHLITSCFWDYIKTSRIGPIAALASRHNKYLKELTIMKRCIQVICDPSFENRSVHSCLMSENRMNFTSLYVYGSKENSCTKQFRHIHHFCLDQRSNQPDKQTERTSCIVLVIKHGQCDVKVNKRGHFTQLITRKRAPMYNNTQFYTIFKDTMSVILCDAKTYLVTRQIIRESSATDKNRRVPTFIIFNDRVMMGAANGRSCGLRKRLRRWITNDTRKHLNVSESRVYITIAVRDN